MSAPLYASTDQLADWLRLTPATQLPDGKPSDRDDLLRLCLNSGERIVNKFCGRVFGPVAEGAVLVDVDVRTDWLMLPADLAVLVSVTDKAETVAASNIRLDVGVTGANGLPGPPWRRIIRADYGRWSPWKQPCQRVGFVGLAVCA